MESTLAPYILAALILVPLAEIAIFIEVGGWIGALPTIALVVVIAVLGTWLLRRQGLETFNKAQTALHRGEMPVAEVLDGLFLIFASLLMVTPGLLTDAVGLMLLVPGLRRSFGRAAMRWFMAHADVRFTSSGAAPDGSAGRRGGGTIIEGEACEVDAEEAKDEGTRPGSPASPWRKGPDSGEG